MDMSTFRPVLDMHTHTLASGHAYGTIREMAQAAAEKGVKLLGISEHAPGIPGTCDEIYFHNLSAVPRELYGVRMMFGSEINIRDDGSLTMSEGVMDRLDYRIAGIHVQCFTPGNRDKNTQAMVAAIRNPRVDIISHPDDGGTPLDYRRVVLAAGESHTLLEVNNSSLRNPARRPNCRENYREMLSLCKKEGVAVIFDSDAHDPSDVLALEAVATFMADIDFPEELVVNTSVEKLLAFLDESHRRIGGK